MTTSKYNTTDYILDDVFSLKVRMHLSINGEYRMCTLSIFNKDNGRVISELTLNKTETIIIDQIRTGNKLTPIKISKIHDSLIIENKHLSLQSIVNCISAIRSKLLNFINAVCSLDDIIVNIYRKGYYFSLQEDSILSNSSKKKCDNQLLIFIKMHCKHKRLVSFIKTITIYIIFFMSIVTIYQHQSIVDTLIKYGNNFENHARLSLTEDCTELGMSEKLLVSSSNIDYAITIKDNRICEIGKNYKKPIQNNAKYSHRISELKDKGYIAAKFVNNQGLYYAFVNRSEIHERYNNNNILLSNIIHVISIQSYGDDFYHTSEYDGIALNTSINDNIGVVLKVDIYKISYISLALFSFLFIFLSIKIGSRFYLYKKTIRDIDISYEKIGCVHDNLNPLYHEVIYTFPKNTIDTFDLLRKKQLLKYHTILMINDILSTGSVTPIGINIYPSTLKEDTQVIDSILKLAHKREVIIELSGEEGVKYDGLIINRLNILRANGIKIALDNFGSGQSNLDMINIIKPDYIKLRMDKINALSLFNESKMEFVAIIYQVSTMRDYETIKSSNILFLQGNICTKTKV